MKIEKDKNFEEERSYLINERNVDEDLILELEKEAIREVERKKQGRKINLFNTRRSKKILDNYKLVLVSSYDKKEDALYFRNVVKYDAVNYKWITILLHLVVCISVLLLGFFYCRGITQKLVQSKFFNLLRVNVILSSISLACIFIIYFCKQFKYNKLDKRSWFDNSFNPYLAFWGRRLIGLLLFTYLMMQFYWVSYLNYNRKDTTILLSCFYLIYLIYFIVNLVKSILDMLQMDIVALTLFVGFPLILGTIKADNWNLAALFIALIYLLISKDIWRLQPGRTNPHLRYNLDDEVIKNNIYRSKVLISVMSIIVYSLVKIRQNFLNENSIIFSVLSEENRKLYEDDIFSKTLFLGGDFFIVAFIGLLIVSILNFIISKSQGKNLKHWIVSPTIDLIVNSIEKQIYKETEINEAEELTKKLDDWKKASKRNHRKKK